VGAGRAPGLNVGFLKAKDCLISTLSGGGGVSSFGTGGTIMPSSSDPGENERLGAYVVTVQ
jgi:hypothetical protein